MRGVESISQLGLAFFGLTFEIAPQARAAVFTQIHEICFHGKGGYDWNTVYNMPIWLRRFTFNKINEYYVEKNKQLEEQSNSNSSSTLIDSSGKVKHKPFNDPTKSKPVKYK
jgi:hypothetical protein